MIGFLTCNDCNLFRWLKLVSIDRIHIEPFSHLHQDHPDMGNSGSQTGQPETTHTNENKANPNPSKLRNSCQTHSGPVLPHNLSEPTHHQQRETERNRGKDKN